MTRTRGRFISFEGGEGTGKSTQARLLAERLRALGCEVVLTREPGGTPGAEAIRALALDPETALGALADSLLHFAARADHVAKIIRPALARGEIVISDRFIDSTLAYQGYGLGAPLETLRTLAGLIDCRPDLTFVLQVPPEIAAARLRQRGGTADRYERLDAETTARITGGFEAIAKAEPERCRPIDASGEIGAIAATIFECCRARLATP